MMGYQRSLWRSLSASGSGGGPGSGPGGGGQVAVVRCFFSEEEIRISFRSAGDEQRLRRAFVHRWFGEMTVWCDVVH